MIYFINHSGFICTAKVLFVLLLLWNFLAYLISGITDAGENACEYLEINKQ